MIKAMSSSYFTILWMFIQPVIASNPDGFCTIVERYAETKPRIETYVATVQVSKKNFLWTHYETQSVTKTRLVPRAVKTRLKGQCCNGYILNESRCMPVCILPCKHAQCTSPNKCTCDPGYVPSVSSHRCNPECQQGYKYNQFYGECRPVCSRPCLNGKCSAPEFCSCSSGFHKNADGICIENEFDDASNSDGFCTVVERYADTKPRIETYVATVQVSKKNFLWTHYETQSVTKTRLVPRAVKTRLKRQCCNGYILNESRCMPVCILPCKNAQCTSPNKCTCDPGYVPSVSSHRCNPECQQGYKYNQFYGECRPVGSRPCLNGKCSALEFCSCSSGFHKNADGVCIENERDVSSTTSGPDEQS